MKTKWNAANIPSQTGRRVVITGANSGIGFQAALELARRGAEIILPARTRAKAEDAVARILKQIPNAKLYPEIIDLAAQSSVREFASRVIERFSGQWLDILINNAGVMALPTREVTVDGFERQFATNYLGPFALTALLLPSIRPIPGSRVVTLSSGISKQGKIDFENLQGERQYKPMLQAYAQSKLADLIFTEELQRRLTAYHQHCRPSGIRGDQPSGCSSKRRIEDTDGRLQAFCPGCRAWCSADSICGNRFGSSLRWLLRSGRSGGNGRVSESCSNSKGSEGRCYRETTLGRVGASDGPCFQLLRVQYDYRMKPKGNQTATMWRYSGCHMAS